MNVYSLLTGSPNPNECWDPKYLDKEDQMGLRSAYTDLQEAGLVPPPTDPNDRLGRRFVCLSCGGSGAMMDRYGERPCFDCQGHSSEDILLPTSLRMLSIWASLGVDNILEVERQAKSFLAWAEAEGLWSSAEGERKLFSREVYGPPTVTWRVSNMVRVVDPLPTGPIEDVVAFLSQRDQVCHNQLLGSIPCRVDGTHGDTVIPQLRDIWNIGVIPARLDRLGLHIWIPK